MLQRVVVPKRLALIFRAGETLGYNPGLNIWERLDDETAEVLRWLRAGRDRETLLQHLTQRFGHAPTEAARRLDHVLGWCVLRRLLYLDQEPALPEIEYGRQTLQTVYWICTQACNLRCTYCYQDADKRRPNELTTDEAKALIVQTAESGARTFVFTGGEPFVRRDLLSLAQLSKECGLNTNVITNGYYITRDNIDEIRHCFDNVTISVDGTMEAHDRTRGRGSWARAVNAVALLADAGVSVDINSVLTKLALRELAELLHLVRSWQIGQHRIVPQFPMGRAGQAISDELTEDEIIGLGDFLYE